MERCNYVQISDGFGHPKLEEVPHGGYQLKEIEGEIIFCELELSQGASLVMRLRGIDKPVVWGHESRSSLPALSGQSLRGFYEEDYNDIRLLAYELLEKNKVLRRGCIDSCKFID